MTRATIAFSYLLALVALVASSGCGGGGRSAQEKEVGKEVILRAGVVLRATGSSPAPTNVEELAKGMEREGAEKWIADELRKNPTKYVIVLNPDFEKVKTSGKPAADMIMAHEAIVPTSGGYVLTGDWRTIEMTPEEFKTKTVVPAK